MDVLTRDYYEENASELAKDYVGAEEGIASWFERAFPEGCRVLDVGAASGRDVEILLKGGWNASGVDPCSSFLREAVERNPHLEGRLSLDQLPGLASVPDAAFDGVLCAAVLMHLPGEHIPESVRNLRRVLRHGGTLLVSLPVDAKGRPVRKREFEGRLFNGLSPSQLQELVEDQGFVLLERGRSLDSLGRGQRQWVTQLFSLERDAVDA